MSMFCHNFISWAWEINYFAYCFCFFLAASHLFTWHIWSAICNDYVIFLTWRNVIIRIKEVLKKQRHYFANKGLSSQSNGFSSSHVWMWEWTIKKAERRGIDAFALWCWRRLLRVPWTARRSNQSILKEVNPEYSLEGLMLKLKLQYFGHLMWRADSLEKTLMLGKIEGRRRRGWQRMRWLDGTPTWWTWVWVNSGSRW